MSPTRTTLATTPVPTLQSLGLRPLINAMGTYTRIGGSRLMQQAAEAMLAASDYYVDMEQLIEAVGHRLAELTGAEWGLVTCGCAAGLAQIAAACIAGADPEAMARLPDVTGLKDEIIVQQTHRNGFEHSLRMTGGRIVEVVTLADLRAAFSPRTALVAITGDLEEQSTIPIATMIAEARERSVPSLVDAAAQRPDVPNRYLQMGADAVLYSGGKCLRGPQSSGLVLGDKALLQTAVLFASPHHGLARPMKVGKEEMMGLLAAVEAWLHGRDHEAEWRQWEGWLNQIRAAVVDLPSVITTTETPGLANHVPALRISWDPALLHVTAEEARRELYTGEPAIAAQYDRTSLRFLPTMLEEDEAEIVARRLRQVLAGRPAPATVEVPPLAAADVSGAWLLSLTYLYGQGKHSMTLEQHQRVLTGRYHTPYVSATLEGVVEGARVSFQVCLGDAAAPLVYHFRGELRGAVIDGVVELGGFGQARWMAERQES